MYEMQQRGMNVMKISSKKMVLCMAKACIDPMEISKAANISYPCVKRAMENGNLKLSTIGKIARALGVEVEELLEEE